MTRRRPLCCARHALPARRLQAARPAVPSADHRPTRLGSAPKPGLDRLRSAWGQGEWQATDAVAGQGSRFRVRAAGQGRPALGATSVIMARLTGAWRAADPRGAKPTRKTLHENPVRSALPRHGASAAPSPAAPGPQAPTSPRRWPTPRAPARTPTSTVSPPSGRACHAGGREARRQGSSTSFRAATTSRESSRKFVGPSGRVLRDLAGRITPRGPPNPIRRTPAKAGRRAPATANVTVARGSSPPAFATPEPVDVVFTSQNYSRLSRQIHGQPRPDGPSTAPVYMALKPGGRVRGRRPRRRGRVGPARHRHLATASIRLSS